MRARASSSPSPSPFLPLLLLLLLSLTSLPSALSQSCTPLNLTTPSFPSITAPVSGGQDLLQLTNLTVPATLAITGGTITALAVNINNTGATSSSFRLALYTQTAGVITLLASTAEAVLPGSGPLHVTSLPTSPVAVLPPGTSILLLAVWFNEPNGGSLAVEQDVSSNGPATVTVSYPYTSTGPFPANVTQGLNPFGLFRTSLQVEATLGVGCSLSSSAGGAAVGASSSAFSSSALSSSAFSSSPASSSVSSSRFSSSPVSSSAVSSSAVSSSAVSSSAFSSSPASSSVFSSSTFSSSPVSSSPASSSAASSSAVSSSFVSSSAVSSSALSSAVSSSAVSSSVVSSSAVSSSAVSSSAASSSVLSSSVVFSSAVSSSAVSSSAASSSAVSSSGLSSSAVAAASSRPVATGAAMILGDPQFTGFLGQRYQVHGVDGYVYNLISAASLQLNARFTFLQSGRCPTVSGVVASDSCWSHPGSYLGELGLQLLVDGQLHRLLLVSGGAEQGFLQVQWDGVDVSVGASGSVGDHVSDDEVSWLRVSSHELRVTTPLFSFTFANSDRFINQQVQLRVPTHTLSTHGLLGQTHRRPRGASAAAVQGHRATRDVLEGDVDDYTLTEQHVFGTDFRFNQFELKQLKL